MKPLIYKVYTS